MQPYVNFYNLHIQHTALGAVGDYITPDENYLGAGKIIQNKLDIIT